MILAEQQKKSTMTNQNIFIVGPSWVGDMVMAQALFATLKQHYPASRLTVLAPKWSKPLLQRMPEVDESLDMPLGHGALRLDIRRRLGLALRKQAYTKAFVLPNSFKSALIPWFAKIPERIGWRGEMRYGLLNDCRVLDEKAYPLMVQRFVALAFAKGTALDKLPRPKLQIDANKVAHVVNEFKLSLDKPILALCPGAEFGPAKQWPAEYYAQVAQSKISAGWQVWLFGSNNDKFCADRIQQQVGAGVVNLTGCTSLAQAIDLLSTVTAVVSNDSGLMHVAAALQKPAVVVYGSTDPSFTPPLSEQVKVLRLGLSCSPCFQRECPLQHMNCLRELHSERVITALQELAV